MGPRTSLCRVVKVAGSPRAPPPPPRAAPRGTLAAAGARLTGSAAEPQGRSAGRGARQVGPSLKEETAGDNNRWKRQTQPSALVS